MEEAPFRPNLYVVVRFLDNLSEPNRSHTRATLQTACGVNYDIFRRYLDLLEAKGLVAIVSQPKADRITITAAGANVRADLLRVLRDFFEENRFPAGKGRALDDTRPGPSQG